MCAWTPPCSTTQTVACCSRFLLCFPCIQWSKKPSSCPLSRCDFAVRRTPEINPYATRGVPPCPPPHVSRRDHVPTSTTSRTPCALQPLSRLVPSCHHWRPPLPCVPVMPTPWPPPVQHLQANTGLHHIDLSGCPMDKSWKKLLHNIMKGQGGGGGGGGAGAVLGL